MSPSVTLVFDRTAVELVHAQEDEGYVDEGHFGECEGKSALSEGKPAVIGPRGGRKTERRLNDKVRTTGTQPSHLSPGNGRAYTRKTINI